MFVYEKFFHTYFNFNVNIYLGNSLINLNSFFLKKKTNSLFFKENFFYFFDGFFFPYNSHQNKTINYFNINFQTSKIKKKFQNFKKYNLKLLTFFKKKITFAKKVMTKRHRNFNYFFTRRRKRKLTRLRFKWLRRYKFSNILLNRVLRKSKYNSNRKKKTKNNKSWYLVASRFKPGFLTEWRKNREAFNTLWCLNLFRQRRLTNFFLSLRGLCGFNYLRLLVLSVGQICRLSFYTINCSLSISLLKNLNFLYKLNGKTLVNPFIQVFLGDCVQMIKSTVFFNKLCSPLSFKKYNLYFKKQNIFKASFFLKLDSPTFLEIDELTLTSVLILEPKLNQLLFFSEIGPLPFLSFRLYNWKYVI